MFVHRQGGASNRPGTEFVAEVKNSNEQVRLFPFRFSDTQSYALEFGHEYIRVYSYGASPTDPAVLEIASPYDQTDLFEINFVQSADVMTLVHPDYPIKELRRLSHVSWQLSDFNLIPDSVPPAGVIAAPNSGGSNTFTYIVTAISDDSGQESLPGFGADGIKTVNSITQADPGQVNVDNYTQPLVDGDYINLNGLVGMEELAGRTVQIENVSIGGTTTFDMLGVDTTGIGPLVGTGTSAVMFYRRTAFPTPTSSSPIKVQWLAAPGAREYNIYKIDDEGVPGLIGITTQTFFNDIGATIDTSTQPPKPRHIFLGTDNRPSAVTYIQQRLTFANTNNDPEKVFMSRTGDFTNFSTSIPTQADDSITFNTAGREVNSVRHLVDLGRLVVLTEGGEWSLDGGDGGVITPTTLNTKQYSYNGSGKLRPIMIDGDAVYQQARGSILRNLTYDFQSDNYRGNDLTVFSNHLFDKFTLVDWDYQQIFHSILWVVRSDGTLLGMTFLKDQNILAWHRHDLGGTVESVTVVPEGNEDVPYFIVKRTINGTEKRYIERFSSRLVKDIEDLKIMDSSLSFDGTNTTATTMEITGGPTWEPTDLLTLTASTSFFVSGDVGNEIHFDGLKFKITSFTSNTVVQGFPNKTVPASLQATPTATWGKAVDEFSNLTHLEGKDVSIFADGEVIASPNNPEYSVLTVTGGQVTIPKPKVKVHIGLPFISDIETLDIDTFSTREQTLADKKKNITQVTLAVEETRGVWVGASAPTGTDATDGLEEHKPRECEDMGATPDLETDNIEITIRGEWNNNGRILVRQIDPVPMSISAIHPSGDIPLSRR